MFGLESNHRYFVCRESVSMRKGIDSLFNLIVSETSYSPMTGDVYDPQTLLSAALQEGLCGNERQS